jgi:hypothetical protein
MKAYLKIKIKSLAAEATMIRREERKHNPGHRARVQARRLLEYKTKIDHPGELANMDVRRSRAFRLLKNKPTEHAMKAFWGLRHHRTWDVRNEARSSHVAYGFLRGLPYSRIEGSAKTSPDWSRVEALIRKYGEDDIRDRMQRFAEWRDSVTT